MNLAIPVGALFMAIFSAYRIYQIVTNKIDLDAEPEELEVEV